MREANTRAAQMRIKVSILLSILPVFTFGAHSARIRVENQQTKRLILGGALDAAPVLPVSSEAQEAGSRTKAPAGQCRSVRVMPAVAIAQPPVETPANQHVWHMTKAEIKDLVGDPNAGTERQLTALSMLIPSGWTLQGRPEYPATADCNFTSGRIGFRANSPDGLTGIRVVPMSASVWSDNRVVLQQIQAQNQMMKSLQQIQIAPPKQISQNLLEAAPRLLPGSQVERSPEPVPEMTGQLQPELDRLNRRLAQQAAAAGRPAPRVSAKAARVKVSWVLNDKAIEAWIIALQTVKTEPLQIGGNFVTNDVPLLAILYAPQGHLDREERILTAMLGSVQLHPEWQAEVAQANLRRIQTICNTKARLNQVYTEIAQVDLRAQQKIAAIQSDVQNYRSNAMSSASRNRNAALDHNTQQFSLYIGDQAIYRNSATGERVQLSNQAGHAWVRSTGNMDEYILTDSPSYNPNGRVGSGNWIELTVER